MAYKTYITEALVCGSLHRNTYDRSFLLFTREAGMVWASARSVRKEKSKQRYALQEFSHIRASLVSGKAGWRVAGVESFNNLYFFAETRKARGLVRNTVRLLRRTIHGEGYTTRLFDDVLFSLARCNEFDQEKLEQVLALRVLHDLGYVSPSDAYSHVLEQTYAYEALTELGADEIQACQTAIEHALLNSQL